MKVLEADNVPPDATAGAGPTPAPDVSAKLGHLVYLSALRQRGVISDQAFLAQRRMLLGAELPLLPAPSAPPAPKKRRRWREAFGVACLILLSLAILGSRLAQRPVQGSTAREPVSTPAAKTNSNDDTLSAVGQPFRLGEYTYTITSYQATTSLGQSSRLRTGQETTYVVVTFTIRNESERGRAVLTTDFQLKDANGVTYHHSPEATAELLTSRTESDFFLHEVPPGATKESVIAFEVPVDSLERPMELIIPEKGLFASGKATVYLNF